MVRFLVLFSVLNRGDDNRAASMFDLQDRCSATTRLVAKGVGADDFVCVNY